MVDSVAALSAPKNSFIKEGLKLNEAYAEGKMKLFQFADYDGDGVISKAEVERYNSPIWVLDKVDGNQLIPAASENPPDVDYRTTQIYAGLTLDQIYPHGLNEFKNVDLDENKVISKEEMQKLEKVLGAIEKDSSGDKLIPYGIAAGTCIAGLSFFSLGKNLFSKSPKLALLSLFGGVVGLLIAWANIKKAENKHDEFKKTTDGHPIAFEYIMNKDK